MMNRRKNIVKELHGLFLPVTDHMGWQNGWTIKEITDFVVKRCGIGTKHDRDNKLFWSYMRKNISVRLHQTLLNEKSKWYLGGLVYLQGRYFFVSNKKEMKLVEDFRKNIVENLKKKNKEKFKKMREYLKMVDSGELLKIESDYDEGSD